MATETWEVWYPKAAATGLLVGRGLLDATNRLLVHAAPDVITVEVHDASGARLAFGQDLERTQTSPVCLCTRDGARIVRDDIWPDEAHLGLPILLPGGEAGILTSWWHRGDRKEWRWSIELHNSIE